MAREQFFHRESESLFRKLEQLSQRSGVSRGAAFEDWLTAMVCALAAETKEEEYLAMIGRHTAGVPGKRGCDVMAQMFAELVTAMDASDADILGDVFQGCITYGEAGQYFTPESVTALMARLTVDPDARPEEGRPITVHDPCCGTGRMLLESAALNPHVDLVGQDVDARCAKITAINLGLRGRFGWVLCGNSLTGETSFAYRVAPYFHESPAGLRRGVIRDVPPETTPVPVIAARSRETTAVLFAETPAAPSAEPAALPIVIEIPRWLALREPSLAAPPDTGEPEPTTPAVPPASPPDGTAPPDRPSQRRLF